MVTFDIYTDKGSRSNNEDSVGVTENEGRYLFALADGLGGHGNGEIASSLAIDVSMKLFLEGYDEDFISKSMNLAQDSVLRKQSEDPTVSEMKTTMVSLILDKEGAVWAHIGDSRLYHFHKNRLKVRTLDHSVPQMLVNLKEIKEKDIRGHEDRNRLLRVIGSPWNNKSFDVSKPVKTGRNESFLLCSDGFWELIEEKTMVSFLKTSKDVKEWMQLMVQEVKRNGQGKDMDNNSAIAVWVRE